MRVTEITLRFENLADYRPAKAAFDVMDSLPERLKECLAYMRSPATVLDRQLTYEEYAKEFNPVQEVPWPLA